MSIKKYKCQDCKREFKGKIIKGKVTCPECGSTHTRRIINLATTNSLGGLQ
jgi:putative FmdB family regulatory protein